MDSSDPNDAFKAPKLDEKLGAEESSPSASSLEDAALQGATSAEPKHQSQNLNPMEAPAPSPSSAAAQTQSPVPPKARRLPPSQRWRRRGRTQALGVSFGGHALLAFAGLGLFLVAGGPKGTQSPPPAPPKASATPIPVVWVDPLAPATPEPPAPPGDFAVPLSALPSALPLPSMPPEATPSTAPSSTPWPTVSLAPMARPRPTPRYATPRPLPPLPTLAPLAPLPAPPSVRPQLSAEQRQFSAMRKFPYFKEMSDEELRRQPLPPGVSNWEELPKLVGRLNGINWLFMPPQTANRQDGVGSGPGLVQVGSESMASGVAPTIELPATMAAIEAGKPYEELSPDGQHLLVVREGNVFLFATWKTGEQEMVVRYRPERSKAEDPEREFRVALAPTQSGREQAVREGFVVAAFEDAASATP